MAKASNQHACAKPNQSAVTTGSGRRSRRVVGAAVAMALHRCARQLDGAGEEHVVLEVDVQVGIGFELGEHLVETAEAVARSGRWRTVAGERAQLAEHAGDLL